MSQARALPVAAVAQFVQHQRIGLDAGAPVHHQNDDLQFIQRDRIAEGWKPFNPAGCEWLMFKKRDKREFQDWFANGGRIDFKLIGFTKMRGCVS